MKDGYLGEFKMSYNRTMHLVYGQLLLGSFQGSIQSKSMQLRIEQAGC